MSKKVVYSDTGPFAIIPKWVLEDSQISPLSIRLYCQLALMADREDGTSYPSRKYLSDRCHCTVRSIANALKELQNCGALMVEQRIKPGTKELDTNKYTVMRQMPWVSIGSVRLHSLARDNMADAELPQEPEAPTPQEQDDLVTRGSLNQSSASLDHPSDDLTQPLPLAAFKDAVIAYLAAPKNKRVSALVDIGDSLGYERNGGFAAALTRDFAELHGMKVVDAMVAGITAKGDPWAYVRKALDGEARRSAGWGQQGGAKPAEGAGGLVTVSLEEVRAAEAAKADEAASAGEGADAGQGPPVSLP